MSSGLPGALVRLVFASIIAIAASDAVSATESRPTDAVAVVVDQATILKLPERIATIVVGNPLIADVTLQPGGTMVVTGKSYGSTNVMAIDGSGNVLLNRTVQVDSPREKLVTVFRGAVRQTYSCNPTCERRIMLGDDTDSVKAMLDQSGSISNAAAAPYK